MRSDDEPLPDGTHTAAFTFEESEHSPDLDRVRQHYRSGPEQLVTEFDEPREAEAESRLPLAAPSSDAERRKHERFVFRSEVIGLSEEAATVLVGHDLSIGGMRVGGSPDVDVGRKLKLAVFGGRRARSRSWCARW